MSRYTIKEATGAELFERDTYSPIAHGGLTTVQLELEVGGWEYDVQADDPLGHARMLENIDELIQGLGKIRKALVERSQLSSGTNQEIPAVPLEPLPQGQSEMWQLAVKIDPGDAGEVCNRISQLNGVREVYRAWQVES